MHNTANMHRTLVHDLKVHEPEEKLEMRILVCGVSLLVTDVGND